MHEVQQAVLGVLLQMLLEKDLIPERVYNQAREKILGTLGFPPFFWENEEDANGSAENSI